MGKPIRRHTRGDCGCRADDCCRFIDRGAGGSNSVAERSAAPEQQNCAAVLEDAGDPYRELLDQLRTVHACKA